MTKRVDFSHITSGVIVPVLVAAALAAGYFLVWPQYKAVQDSKANLAAKQTVVNERKASIDSVKNLVADLEKKRASLSAIDEALPLSPDLPVLLANVEYLANQSGMAVENLQIQSSTGPSASSGQVEAIEPKTGTIGIDLTVQGRYPQLLALILNVEKNLRLMDIKSISFGPPDEETGSRSYAVQLLTYYQKP